jgi:SulP family sulfate permease
MSKAPAPAWPLFVPKLITVLRQGYGLADFRQDCMAGLTVAIVALPLSLALAIASGTTPDRGLTTAIVAGLLISALGGSRFQIGGPTGAFVVVVFNVIAQHGYEGLLLATALAGCILIIAGFARLGTWIKYIPQPVITGFTAGIALVIFSSQVKDLFGLSMSAVPADFIEKWAAYAQHFASWSVVETGIAALALAIILALRKYAPSQPAFLITVVVASLLVWLTGLDAATIGSRFGELPRTLPVPALPSATWPEIKALIPSAFTIAFLAGVESLLSAVIADGMTGRRHRSNCELVAQGIANIVSPLFGGLPATGAIARTATNIRSGARSPIAGMLHAVFLLVFMLALSPLIEFIPLASLAAVLVIVAWNMSEVHRFRTLLRAPLGDRVILLMTFVLTVLVDLTVAIAVGVVLAAMMFMHRMAEAVAIRNHTALPDEDIDDFTRPREERYTQQHLPQGVEMFELRGPLFFGTASRLDDLLQRLGPPPKMYILLLRDVPLIDATGVSALQNFIDHCRRIGTEVVLAEVDPTVVRTLSEMQLTNGDHVVFVDSIEQALQRARAIAI